MNPTWRLFIEVDENINGVRTDVMKSNESD